MHPLVVEVVSVEAPVQALVQNVPARDLRLILWALSLPVHQVLSASALPADFQDPANGVSWRAPSTIRTGGGSSTGGDRSDSKMGLTRERVSAAQPLG